MYSLRNLLVKVIAATAPHRLFFTVATGLVSLLIAILFLRMSKKALREERWIRYFGVGFLVFGIYYAMTSLMNLASPGVVNDRSAALELLRTLASVTSSAAFLAAGLALYWPDFKFKPWHWVLAWSASAIAFVMDWAEWPELWNRLPEGLYSAVAAALLGSVFYRTSPRTRLWLTALATVWAGLYVLLSLAYSCVPVLAAGRIFPSFAHDLAVNLPYPFSPRAALDTALIAVALVIKILLATSGFVLILQALTIISPRTLSPVLEGVARGDLNFFSSEGIVKAIGKSLEADRVSLSYRLPGLSVQRLARWEWRRSESSIIYPITCPLPSGEERGEGEVLASGEIIKQLNCEGTAQGRWPWRRIRDAKSRILVPIFNHGHIMGCLAAEWNDSYAFTSTAVQHMARLAELLAPSIEPRRSLVILAEWNTRLQAALANCEESSIGDQKLAAVLSAVVYEILAPLAVAVSFDVGFDPVWAVSGDQGVCSGLQRDLPAGALERILYEKSGSADMQVRLIRKGIALAAVHIGTLAILWPLPRKMPARPVIVPDELLLITLTNLILVAFREAAQERFSSSINQLQIRLGSIQDREGWLEAVAETVRREGIEWADAAPGASEDGRSTSSIEMLPCVPRSIDDRALRIPLPKSEVSLWLGIKNLQLDPELTEGWPWRTFLDRLAEAADASLARFKASQELEKLQYEAGHMRVLLKATVDAGTFIHEMRNIARNFQFSAQSLESSLRDGLLHGPDEIQEDIAAMLVSANRLYLMADNVLQPSKLDGNPVFSLSELVKEVYSLVQPVLHQHRIEFVIEVPQSLQVGVPSHVAHMALISLVSNSIDAIAQLGTIQIDGESTGKDIRCHVRDSGPGIQLENPELVFDLGVSTKGTGGKGLFMIRDMLQREGADIILTDSRASRTCFTLIFPLPL